MFIHKIDEWFRFQEWHKKFPHFSIRFNHKSVNSNSCCIIWDPAIIKCWNSNQDEWTYKYYNSEYSFLFIICAIANIKAHPQLISMWLVCLSLVTIFLHLISLHTRAYLSRFCVSNLKYEKFQIPAMCFLQSCESELYTLSIRNAAPHRVTIPPVTTIIIQ